MDTKSWWIVHGIQALQKIALKLLGQPCSTSCCERIWSTYSFIHFLKRNKMTLKRDEDLVNYKEDESKLWDIVDDFSLDENEILDIASLSFKEPKLEVVFFNEDEQM